MEFRGSEKHTVEAAEERATEVILFLCRRETMIFPASEFHSVASDPGFRSWLPICSELK